MKFSYYHQAYSTHNNTRLGGIGLFGASAETIEEAFEKTLKSQDSFGTHFRFPVLIKTEIKLEQQYPKSKTT